MLAQDSVGAQLIPCSFQPAISTGLDNGPDAVNGLGNIGIEALANGGQ
jgi:hypothetical protein